jgi:hypothetical protein
MSEAQEDYGGCLLLLEGPKLIETVESRIEEERKFTCVVSGPDWKLQQLDLFLLSTDNKSVGHIGLVARGGAVATSTTRVTFREYAEIMGVTFDVLRKQLDARLVPHFDRVLGQRGGRIPPGTWNALLEAIKKVDPKAKSGIDRLDALRRDGLRALPGERAQIVAQEKDATLLALGIFGIDKSQRELGLNYTPGPDLAPFLQGIGRATLREDQHIAHDAERFLGWKITDNSFVGAKRFEKDGETLSVVNVNRTPLETTLGVDLIYCHHGIGSFVLVQYKRMVKRAGDSTFVYRPIEPSYKKEIERMQAWDRHLGGQRASGNPIEYRLHSGAFFFKLCGAVTLKPLSTDLITGMYLPLDYWLMLEQSPEMKGKKGGVAFSFESVNRYITNSDFISLMRNGWVGSRGKGTEILKDVIEASVTGSRSAIVAVAGDQTGRFGSAPT